MGGREGKEIMVRELVGRGGGGMGDDLVPRRKAMTVTPAAVDPCCLCVG